MSRIAAAFEKLGAAQRKALIPYLCAGDPFADATVDILHALVAGGADMIELGVPFSDPMADGPVVEQAAGRALARGVGLAQVLQDVRQFRQRDATTPVVLMGYANPLERYDHNHGAGSFVRDAAAAGVDGVLAVDYPPEECGPFAVQARAQALDVIFLLAPTSTEQRIRQVGAIASGYVYYVSIKGVTGAEHLDTSAVVQAVPLIRRHVKVPVCVGFGIRDAASARAVARVADGVVVGSRLIEILQNQSQTRDNAAAAARGFMAEIRAALDGR